MRARGHAKVHISVRQGRKWAYNTRTHRHASFSKKCFRIDGITASVKTSSSDQNLSPAIPKACFVLDNNF